MAAPIMRGAALSWIVRRRPKRSAMAPPPMLPKKAPARVALTTAPAKQRAISEGASKRIAEIEEQVEMLMVQSWFP